MEQNSCGWIVFAAFCPGIHNFHVFARNRRRERVNRYTVNFGNMFTLPVTYGKMFLNGKRLW